jgi:NDP-sugar pyrophosphorylase family protein
MKAGLIAAGHGARLREAGITLPKPLVEVAGRPLIDHVLDATAAAGIEAVACIFNADFDAVEAHCRRRGGPPRLTIVRRTTPSSMESLFTLAPLLGDLGGSAGASPTQEHFLLLTVDAIFAPTVLRDFLAAAAERREADVVLAVTDFIDDEKPLRIALDGRGRATALGVDAAASPFITAGFYVFHPRVFAQIEAARAARLSALRQWLGALLSAGYRLEGVPIGKTLDVDRPADIAAAEAFVRSGYTR